MFYKFPVHGECLLFGHSVNKEDIIPPVPILTRYSREGGIKALVRKEHKDPRLPDLRRSTEINILTTPTLCVQLNTLYVSFILFPCFHFHTFIFYFCLLVSL